MGSDSSQPKTFEAEPYIVLDDCRRDASPIRPSTNVQRAVNCGFASPWTMRLPKSVTPPPRTSHFSAYFSERNVAICGYGINGSADLLSDVWQLDLSEMKWSLLELTGDLATPRNGTTAVRLGSRVALFGGFSGTCYLSDFHVIDLETLEVSRPAVTGDGPSGRIGHVMAEHDGEIMVWGGYNGDWLSDLWILDTKTMTWCQVETDMNGRTSATWASHGDSLYIFGAAKTDPLLCFDWKRRVLDVVKTTGVTPQSELSQAAMVAVDRYLLVFGGKLEQNKYTLMYGYDTVRHKWFVFHVVPDGTTTTVEDGVIDKNGFFLLPTGWSASMVYCEKERRVMLFLGAPMMEPPKIGIVEVGEAFAVLHLGNDMVDMVNK